jgi:hypothetical protein
VTVRVFSDEFSIADGVELTHQRVPLGNVYGLALRIVAVELKDGRDLG